MRTCGKNGNCGNCVTCRHGFRAACISEKMTACAARALQRPLSIFTASHPIRRHSMPITIVFQRRDDDTRCARETFPKRYRRRIPIAETGSCNARSRQRMRGGATFLRISTGRFVSCSRHLSHRFVGSRDADVKQKSVRGAAARSAAPSRPRAAALARRLYVAPIRQHDEATRDAIDMNRAAARCRAIPSCADARHRASAARRTAGCIRG